MQEYLLVREEVHTMRLTNKRQDKAEWNLHDTTFLKNVYTYKHSL